MPRKLGENQQAVLRALHEHREWPSSWVWDNPSGTRKILESLVNRGLVKKTVEKNKLNKWATRIREQYHPVALVCASCGAHINKVVHRWKIAVDSEGKVYCATECKALMRGKDNA